MAALPKLINEAIINQTCDSNGVTLELDESIIIRGVCRLAIEELAKRTNKTASEWFEELSNKALSE